MAALGTKLDCLTKPGSLPYDMGDAMDYFGRSIAIHGGSNPVHKAWAEVFKFQCAD